jgi:ornithine carbamoyltransferase
MLGVRVRIASPKEYSPRPWLVEAVEKLGGTLEVYDDPRTAVKGADVIYTDVFVSMGEEDIRAKKLSEFLPRYQVNMDLLRSSSKDDVMFMHCLPARRGEEVTDEVIESRYSIVFDQAENRLHTQKAILSILAEEGFL